MIGFDLLKIEIIPYLLLHGFDRDCNLFLFPYGVLKNYRIQLDLKKNLLLFCVLGESNTLLRRFLPLLLN